MTRFMDNAYTSGGGLIGSLLGYITFDNVLDAMVIAVIGALVGYLVKLIADYCKLKISKCLKRKNGH